MRRLLLIGILAALAAPGGSSAAAGCGNLTGHFAGVPGSAGAGNIVYRLSVHNGGVGSCLIRGLPALLLLDVHGKALPTHVVLDPRSHSRTLLLKAGKTATATARFSPDIPGPGEPVSKRCEPLAYNARVSAGGVTFLVPIRPRPTSVCEHGRLVFTTYR